MVTNGVTTGCCSTRPTRSKVERDVAALPKSLRTASPTPSRCTPGIMFHDGTPLNSAAVTSFARRTAIKRAVYMLAQVKSVDTPDATTLIVP